MPSSPRRCGPPAGRPRGPSSPILAAALALAAPGCQDYLFEQKCPEAIREAEFTRPAARPTPADILFVVDNSGSMADEQENLARNFELFINQIAGAGDYHIAVVTTDQTNDLEQQGLATFAFNEEFPNNYVSPNLAACVPTDIAKGCFRGPSPERRLIASSALDRAQQIAAFQDNVRVGSCGSGDEEGLEAMVAALEQTRAGGCNAGFLRDDANLVIVFVSDEEEQSDQDIRAFVDALVTYKPIEKVRVAMVVGSVDGQPSRCNVKDADACGSLCRNMPDQGSLSPCAPGAQNQCGADEYCQNLGGGNGRCRSDVLRFWDDTNCAHCSYFRTPDCCSALAGSRYIEFAQAVEQRISAALPDIPATGCRGEEGQRIACLVDSICQESFGETLERIARDLVITTTYALDPPAVNPDGVTVRLKGGRFGAGQQLVPGTDFTVNRNADGLGVELNIAAADNTPREGEEIDIFYVSERTDNRAMPIGACGLDP